MLRTIEIQAGPGLEPDPSRAAKPADREGLAGILAAYQREIGAPGEAVAAAESLAGDDTVVVVTGQQPVLLGGPLLVISKALSAIAHARRLTEERGVPAVPVFWVASEDHDLVEVGRVKVLSAADELRDLSVPIEPDGRMVSEVDPGEHAEVLLRELEEILPASEYTKAVLAPLRDAMAPSLGRWFARILTRWLGGLGLVIVEPHLLRRAAAGVLELEKRRPGAITGACGEGPVAVASVPFFRLEEGRRRRPGSVEDLPDDPDGVSWDVVTRVLAQDLALPVAGQVVGPAELRYCSQVAPAHELLGIPAPPLLPRARLTLVERKVEKALGAFGVDLADVLAGGESALAAADGGPEAFESALTGVERALSDAWVDVRDEAGRVDEVLVRKAEGAERALLSAIDRLRDHARRALDRAEGRDVERRRKVLAHLLPGGAPQERVLSPLPFLVRHGPELFSKLLRVVKRWPDGHRAVLFGSRR